MPKLNHYAECLGKGYFVCPDTDKHTRRWPTALRGHRLVGNKKPVNLQGNPLQGKFQTSSERFKIGGLMNDENGDNKDRGVPKGV